MANNRITHGMLTSPKHVIGAVLAVSHCTQATKNHLTTLPLEVHRWVSTNGSPDQDESLQLQSNLV